MPDAPKSPDSDDVRAAVAAGVIDERAAAGFAAFLDARRGARSALGPDDEPFELFRGFGEVFVTIGLILLLAPLCLWIGPMIGGLIGHGETQYNGRTGGLIGGLSSLLLAHYFTARRRMALPSILLAITFAISVAAVAMGLLASSIDADGNSAALAGIPAAVCIAMFWYYWRFRLPFALALVGAFALATILTLADAILGSGGVEIFNASSYLDLAQAPAYAIGVLLYGLIAFIFAMRFDMQDRHRVARQSACAFWLHITAAPALVNTICLSLYNYGGLVGYLGAALGLTLVALLGLAIDRRSFLIAGAVYAGLVIGAAFEAAGGQDIAGPLTVLLLGASITLLGAKWAQARRRLLAALPEFPGKDRLPPY